MLTLTLELWSLWSTGNFVSFFLDKLLPFMLKPMQIINSNLKPMSKGGYLQLEKCWFYLIERAADVARCYVK